MESKKMFTLHYYTWKNIGMSTYYGTQTFYATTNSYFLINVQFCFEMRTNPFTVDHNPEGACELIHKIACSRKKARDTT